MMKRLAVLAFTLLIPCALRAGTTPTNIALHKPYTFSVPPNQNPKPADATNLTDGARTTKVTFWDQHECVGWNAVHKPVSITIDLGQDQPISGASFETAATGAYGFPTSLAISVSTDGKSFHYAGDLTRLDESWFPKNGSYAIHNYRTTSLSLRTHGRYVRVTGISSGLVLFCDEIEVYKGDDAWLKQSPAGPVMTDDQLADPLRLTQLGVFRRITSDWAQVHGAVEKNAKGAIKQQLLAELDALKPEIQKESYPASLRGFKAILPIGPVDAQILAVYGKLLAHEGVPSLTLWHTRPYQLLDLLQKPTPGSFNLNVSMMGNEHRAEVFNLTNASGEPKTVKFTITGLPANAGLTVYQVETVDNRVGWPRSSPLVALEADDGRYSTIVAAGMTRQIWLSFNSADTPAGNYTGQVHLSSDPFHWTIPLRLSVAPVRMADKMALNSGMWDYIFTKTYAITSANQDAAARDLLDHLINTVWGNSNCAPFPKGTDFDKEGNLTGKIDYSQWDDFVNFWRSRSKNITRFCVSTGMTPDGAFGGFKLNSPQYERAIGQWALDWARHNKELGLKPRQAMIVFIDEPAGSRVQAVYNIVKPFKSLTRDVGVITNPLIYTAQEVNAAKPMMELSDMIVPTMGVYHKNPPEVQAVYQALRAKGKELGFYQCTTPVMHFDPSYYRLQPWRAFVAGADFSGFWAFADNGRLEDSWNPYTAIAASNYTPLMISPDGVSGSKHWEALREGIEDYQYLYMLSQKIGHDAALRDARKMTEALLKKDEGYAWHESDASQFAEAERLEILRQLSP